MHVRNEKRTCVSETSVSQLCVIVMFNAHFYSVKWASLSSSIRICVGHPCNVTYASVYLCSGGDTFPAPMQPCTTWYSLCYLNSVCCQGVRQAEGL